jgi:hypothetical protein
MCQLGCLGHATVAVRMQLFHCGYLGHMLGIWQCLWPVGNKHNVETLVNIFEACHAADLC